MGKNTTQNLVIVSICHVVSCEEFALEQINH